QLLHKLCIRADNNSQKLLKVIKNPVCDYLPVGCRKYLTSFNAPNLVNFRELAPSADTNESIAVVVGAMARGKYFERVLIVSGCHRLLRARYQNQFLSAFGGTHKEDEKMKKRRMRKEM
uniref:Uncharacterized protein n=1 Tax=Romanomermis culicivorax TaxID=13658 RepID=A0A915KY48_ROMCU